MHSMIREFAADWKLTGRSQSTSDTYLRALRTLIEIEPDVDEWSLATVKLWLAAAPTKQTARMRGRAARAFIKWAHTEGALDAPWWSRIPLANVEEAPQETATDDDYRAVMAKCTRPRDKAIVSVLWSSGLRRAEVSRLTVEDVDLDGAHLLVRKSKTGRPRVAPLSPEAVKHLRIMLRRHPGQGPLWIGQRGPLDSDGVKSLLRRLNAPSSHAWRRGWAVSSLKGGVSQVSVQSAGGWSSGLMVARYTRGLAEELALSEFGRRWA